MAPQSGAIHIFTPRHEYALLAFPLVLIVLVLAQLATGVTFNGKSENFLWLIADIICINGLHYIYTFRLAFTVPVYRRILSDHWRRFGLSAILFIGFLCIALKVVEPHLTGNVRLAESLFIFLIPAFHGIRQSLGISLIYNQLARRSGGLSEGMATRLTANEKWERRGPAIILGLSGTFFISCQVGVPDFILQPMKWMFSLTVMGYAAYVVFLYTRLDARLFKLKLIFLARTFLLALTYFSMLPGIGLCAIHGIEYYLVSNRILSHAGKSEKPDSRGFILLYLFLTAAVVAGTLVSQNVGLPGFIFSGGWQDHTWVRIATYLVTGLALFHVYLDGVMFAMSKVDVRTHTGHWLLSDAIPQDLRKIEIPDPIYIRTNVARLDLDKPGDQTAAIH